MPDQTVTSRMGHNWRLILSVVLAALCLEVYLFIVMGSIDKPFATDEIYYAGWAHGIANTGSPVYYSGENDGLHYRLVEPISHPLLHFNLLGVMFLLFGYHYWSLRLLGVIFFAATLLYLRFVVLKKDEHPTERLILMALLMVFNPLFMQQSMVLAIESQVFWFPLLVFLYVFYRESTGHARFKYYPYLVSTGMMICLLWMKETNLPMYLGGCTLFLLLIRKFRLIPVYWVSLVVAIAVFWGSWVVYCQITDVDVYSWWNFTVVKKSNNDMVLHNMIAERGLAFAVSRVLSSLRVSISWISLPYLVLFFTAIGVRVRDLVTGRRKLGFMELCLVYALVTFGICKIVRPTDPFIKYENPAYLLVAMFITDVFFNRLRKAAPLFVAAVVLAVVGGFVSYGFIPDRLLGLHRNFPSHVVHSLVLVTLATAALMLIQRSRSLTAVVIGLFVGLVALNTNVTTHQSTNDYTTGQSWGNYGEDLVAPTKWLRKHMKNGDGFAAFKDLQFNMRFIEGKTESPTWEARVFTSFRLSKSKKKKAKALLNSGRIRYIVLNRYSRRARGQAFLKRNNYRQIKKIKGHLVFERIACPYCEEEKARAAKKKKRSKQVS